ncbi:MAG: 4Fe-4S binding protein [bacterium]
MPQGESHFHYVCTFEEAEELLTGNQRFWISNCGCREQRGGCQRSRVDLCLSFRAESPTWGSAKREITGAETADLLQDARNHRLVPRPFRREDDKTVTDGICFCCDDCCEYFTKPADNHCDKGIFIEVTDSEICSSCGTCTEVCYFEVRRFDGCDLEIVRDFCYGCGLCRDVCPEGAIMMVDRNL